MRILAQYLSSKDRELLGSNGDAWHCSRSCASEGSQSVAFIKASSAVRSPSVELTSNAN